MPFYPNDDRYYDIVNKSGDNYRQDRGRVAEEQAASKRELGQMYGQMLPKTLKAGMEGADWRQQREMKNQAYQGEQANQARAEETQGFERSRQGRLGEEWGIRKPMMENDATTSKLNMEERQRQADWDNADAGSEESAQLHYSGDKPLTRGQAHLMREGQGEQLGLDTSKQSLANAKQAASAMAAQIAQNATRFENDQYTFASNKALTEYQDILGIQDPKVQAAAAQEWRARYAGSLMSPELLSNMAEGANSKRQQTMAGNQAQRVIETKLAYPTAIAEAESLTQKLNAVQKLNENAKTYTENAHAGGAWENPNAKDARDNSAMILTNLGKHQAAERVRGGMFAGARDLLSEQAQQQASETVAEFDSWYARQDDRIKNLPEVSRAYQQAQALKTQTQGPTDGPSLRKLPSLVGPGGGAPGGNTQANANFMGGIPAQGGAHGYGQAPQATTAGFALGQIPLPGRAAPQQQQTPMGPGQVPPQAAPAPGQMPGQAPGQDPYGLQKTSQPRAIPAGVNGQGGFYGSR